MKKSIKHASLANDMMPIPVCQRAAPAGAELHKAKVIVYDSLTL